MKKIIALTLAALLCVFMFAACGKDDAEETTEPESTTAETTELSYTLVINGEEKTGKTDAATVGELLENEGIEIGEDDTLTPAADTELTDGIKIVIEKAEEEETEAEEEDNTSTAKPTTGNDKPQTPVTQAPATEPVSDPPATEPSTEPATEPSTDGGRTVVGRQAVDDCDGSGHGYYIISYSDGTTEYEDY